MLMNDKRKWYFPALYILDAAEDSGGLYNSLLANPIRLCYSV